MILLIPGKFSRGESSSAEFPPILINKFQVKRRKVKVSQFFTYLLSINF
uniref:Uncharacterized protein n=1 Tax=Lepeophtheirus salmonis TaxID=72036 RepID=A0A0K2VER9_LEPSM